MPVSLFGRLTSDLGVYLLSRLVLASMLAIASTPLHALTYTLESEHTQGVIRWNHPGFANPSAQFSMVKGTLNFDPADIAASSVVVTIPLAALSTGVADLNDDFRSSYLFDIDKFPTATFKSSRVENDREPGKFKVTGDLSLHGISKPVTLQVSGNKVGTNPRNQLKTVGFEATAVLNRSDFGLGKYVPQVGDAVDLHITAEAAEAQGYADYLKAQEARAAARATKKD